MTDPKLRKDALAKDMKLEELLREGEANELARQRSATLEQRHSVKKVEVGEAKELTDEEAAVMIQKLKKAGKYSTKTDKESNKNNCDRCVYTKTPHAAEGCFFKEKECHACGETGHMKGSKRCRKKAMLSTGSLAAVVGAIGTIELVRHPGEVALPVDR